MNLRRHPTIEEAAFVALLLASLFFVFGLLTGGRL